MDKKRAVHLLISFSVACWIVGCSASRRTEKVISKTASPGPSTAVNEPLEARKSAQPEWLLKAEEHSVQRVVEDARLLYMSGRSHWAAGEVDKARVYFRESLEIVSKSGFDPLEYPVLEETYQHLLGEIQRLEIVASARADEPPFPILNDLAPSESPLDEIGAINLYEVEVDPGLEDLVSEDLRQTKFDVPVVVNKEVLRFLDYYQGRGHKAMEQSLKRSGKYLTLFREIFREEGIPLDLVYMAHVESLFKPQAYSRARARGIWQFVKGTALLYDLKVGWWLDERLDLCKATRSAAIYLRDLYQDFGSWYLALAAYNGGPGRVSRVIRRYGGIDYWTMAKRRLLRRETRNYVPSILAAIIVSKHPERYGFEVDPDPPVVFETVPIDYQVDLKVVAESVDEPLTKLTQLNPELQRGVTPFDGEAYYLKVPPGKGKELLTKLAAIPPEKRLRLRHHKVRKGETLSLISGRYGTSIQAIAEVNRIRNIHRLKLGQDLIIPLSDWRAARASRTEGERIKSSSGKHTVRRGDSLYQIARLYGVSVADLFKWNNIEPGQHIHPGQQIRVSAYTRSPANSAGSNAGNN